MKSPLPQNPIADAIADLIHQGVFGEVRVTVTDSPNAPINVEIMWAEVTTSRGFHDAPGQPTDLPADDKPLFIESVSRWPHANLEIAADWDSPATIQQWVTDIAWALGAGYLWRIFTPPEIAGERGQWKWMHNSGYRLHTSSALNDGAPGYAGAIANEWLEQDSSRNLDGSRSGPFPGWQPNEFQVIADTYETNYEDQTAIGLAWNFDTRKCDPSLMYPSAANS